MQYDESAKKRINLDLNINAKDFSNLIIIIKIIPKKKESGLKKNDAIKEKLRKIKTMDLYLFDEKIFIRKIVIPTTKSVI